MTRTPEEGTAQGSRGSSPAPHRPLPTEPEDVNALLADSLKAQSEEDFTWKEPQRRPRWYERAEMQQATAATDSSVAEATDGDRHSGSGRGPRRTGQFVLAMICLLLALWCLAALVLGIVVDPLVVALTACTMAGAALVIAGLRPKPGRRL